MITASRPQARLFGAESGSGPAIDIERDGLLLLERMVGRGGYGCVGLSGNPCSRDWRAWLDR